MEKETPLQNESFFRLGSIPVRVGDLVIGNKTPIKVQSMTTTNTMDTLATAEEVVRIYESGADLVRITAPNLKAAENLYDIKNALERRGKKIPLVADIHFTPKAAELAAEVVEKVRINPGNFVDRKLFQTKVYSEKEYQQELEFLEERLVPLLAKCKKHGTALRIGTNHGSLSDRIVNHHGDSPKGMVESAYEFVRICEKHDFDQMVISMKSSNPIVMVQAYRLLSALMDEEGVRYPLHLGVTEAGDSFEGRTKSAVGIGTLLADGIGDTIRVSLTEKPELEPQVARKMLHVLHRFPEGKNPLLRKTSIPIDPFTFERRRTKVVHSFGGTSVPKVITIPKQPLGGVNDAVGRYRFERTNDQKHPWERSDLSPDGLFLRRGRVSDLLELPVASVHPHDDWKIVYARKNAFFYYDSVGEFASSVVKHKRCNVVGLQTTEADDKIASVLKPELPIVLVLKPVGKHVSQEVRNLVFWCHDRGIVHPVLLGLGSEETKDPEQRIIDLSMQAGPLFIDGLLDGLWLNEFMPFDVEAVFNILQASRARISKPEYISCPSCGRTYFDIQEVTARIKSKTSHLKGVKIGIMGCIVNGPGEMADADFGYVGVGNGLINLYRKRDIVKRNIPEEEAVRALVELIREHGMWVEPQKEKA